MLQNMVASTQGIVVYYKWTQMSELTLFLCKKHELLLCQLHSNNILIIVRIISFFLSAPSTGISNSDMMMSFI